MTVKIIKNAYTPKTAKTTGKVTTFSLKEVDPKICKDISLLSARSEYLESLKKSN